MARLSYKGTSRRCKQIMRDANMAKYRCTESASKGSDYCLKHKHALKKK